MVIMTLGDGREVYVDNDDSLWLKDAHGNSTFLASSWQEWQTILKCVEMLKIYMKDD